MARPKKEQAKRPSAVPASRICLRCGKAFASDGPWNRICDGCIQSNKGVREGKQSHKFLHRKGGEAGESKNMDNYT